MDERLSGWEDRLRYELDASVRDVRAGDDLLGRVREGGRRRVRRRRALVALPAAVVVAGGVAGGVVWAGRSAPPRALAPASTPSTSSAPSAPSATATGTPRVGTEPPVLAMDADAARDVFSDAGFGYEDAVPLGELWNVDPWEAKALGGQVLADGDELPVPR
ncbi:hypothetical protein [Kineococcus sp. SYSU DK001]|uniref:hypothetical protein n=1 Tax=Kineococcus sp. SYSU DK001 TaxID=3383122 RepID=UPI003D7DE889